MLPPISPGIQQRKKEERKQTKKQKQRQISWLENDKL